MGILSLQYYVKSAQRNVTTIFVQNTLTGLCDPIMYLNSVVTAENIEVLSYEWVQTSGPAIVFLTTRFAKNTSFTNPFDGQTRVFRFYVNRATPDEIFQDIEVNFKVTDSISLAGVQPVHANDTFTPTFNYYLGDYCITGTYSTPRNDIGTATWYVDRWTGSSWECLYGQTWNYSTFSYIPDIGFVPGVFRLRITYTSASLLCHKRTVISNPIVVAAIASISPWLILSDRNAQDSVNLAGVNPKYSKGFTIVSAIYNKVYLDVVSPVDIVSFGGLSYLYAKGYNRSVVYIGLQSLAPATPEDTVINFAGVATSHSKGFSRTTNYSGIIVIG